MIALPDTQPHHCRWPIHGTGADMFCCGAQTRENSSYCAAHHAVAYLPPREARREKRAMDKWAGQGPVMTTFPRVDAAE